MNNRFLHWFRADLRMDDNTALLHACQSADTEVCAIYFISPKQWLDHDFSANKIDFELRQLIDLQKNLKKYNIALLIEEVPSFKEIPQALLAICQKYKIKNVVANAQYEWNEKNRDIRCAQALKEHDINFQCFHDQCLIAPAHLSKNDGGVYTVFTPFKNKWLSILQASKIKIAPHITPRKKLLAESTIIPKEIKNFPCLLSADIKETWWPAGEAAAHHKLNNFIQHHIHHYDHARNFPAQSGVSTLSPYLAIGAISIRHCLHQAFLQQSIRPSKGVEQWITELAWRDFYKHILFAFPHVNKYKSFKPDLDKLQWRHDANDFEHWCNGTTGFPLVDAAMRQLKQTGWMHNRLRMVTAMFLCKDLAIDWRWGEKFFMQHLIDGDFSANNGGWQWSASTGTDSAPYFRIFNPTTQSEKFDPEGEFIRQYIPELAHLSTAQIHAPYDTPNKKQSSLWQASLNYPAPMVDHAAARERTLALFKAVKTNNEAI